MTDFVVFIWYFMDSGIVMGNFPLILSKIKYLVIVERSMPLMYCNLWNFGQNLWENL